VFLLFRRLTNAFCLSAFSAALFAWHPLRVESVAWIAERKDVLSGFFGLLALLAYVVYAQQRGAKWYWLSLGTFALGLLAKPTLSWRLSAISKNFFGLTIWRFFIRIRAFGLRPLLPHQFCFSSW